MAEARKKQRLFVDIDGTLAVFKPVDTLETLYEKGYLKNNGLIPLRNVCYRNVLTAILPICESWQNRHPKQKKKRTQLYLKLWTMRENCQALINFLFQKFPHLIL